MLRSYRMCQRRLSTSQPAEERAQDSAIACMERQQGFGLDQPAEAARRLSKSNPVPAKRLCLSFVATAYPGRQRSEWSVKKLARRLA